MDVFVTGGTGYLGRATIGALLNRRHAVRVLTRPTSQDRVPAGAAPVVGDALDSATFADALFTTTTLVHLVGTPHPGPSKAAEFEHVDLASIRSSVEAARRAQIAHLVYVSVAQPAPVMRAYVAARAKGEAAIVEARLTATMLRPWYVLGPDHRWPIVLKPSTGLRSGRRRRERSPVEWASLRWRRWSPRSCKRWNIHLSRARFALSTFRRFAASGFLAMLRT